jgi:2-oxoisovalerate dehydrogenase E2 component (dihydrolipoyl transacylase)
MATTITMPQLGETVTEGTVSQWLKKPGDTVDKYEPFVEIATDKVSAEIPSPVSGIIRTLIAREGQTVPTGAAIAIIDEIGGPRTTAEPATATATASEPQPEPTPSTTPTESAHFPAQPPFRQRVSPAVRRLAREHRIDLDTLRGSGANGRITAKDVLARRKTHAAHALGETIPLTQARRLIAERMVESKHTIPHAWTMVETDVTHAWKLRTHEKEAFERKHGVKLTLLPFFIRAVAAALRQHPLMNARFTEQGIHLNREINISMAVGMEGNLLLPVLRNADTLSVTDLARATASLAEKARAGKLGPDDLSGGTFTVNNTGSYGSVLSAPIIPLKQTGVVTMEAVVKRAVVREDDAIAIRSMMNVCLSLDHRVVDGSIACAFLADIKGRLEAIDPNGVL